jgi:integrase
MKDNHPSVTELRGVTEEIAYAFAAHLGQTQTPNTYNKYMVLFRRMWKVLIKPARLTSNPWAALDNKLLATHSRRELTLEELITVCASVSGEMRTLFAVGLYCGLRLGDAVLLKWSNVDLIRRVLIIIPAKTARRSNGKALKIPVHGSLLAMLSETPEEQRNGYIMPGLVEEYQFKNTRGTYLVKRISEVFKACKIETQCKVEGYSRLGVDVGFHSLRHSFVSLSANAGSSLAAVQAVVGHSNPSMTRHYLHADQTLVQNAVYALPDVTDNKSMGDEKAATTEEIDTVKKVVERMTAEQLKQLAHQVRAAIAKTEFQQAPEQIPACA